MGTELMVLSNCVIWCLSPQTACVNVQTLTLRNIIIEKAKVHYLPLVSRSNALHLSKLSKLVPKIVRSGFALLLAVGCER